MGIKLVAKTTPVVSTSELAIFLAEALQGVVQAEREADAFSQQMQVENQKLTQLRFTLDQVERYRKNPPPNPSRMDPMLTYDLDMLNRDMELCRQRVQEWTETRDQFLRQAREGKTNIAKLQKELTERKKRGE